MTQSSKRRQAYFVLTGFVVVLLLAAAWLLRDFLVPQRTALIESDEFILYSLEPMADYSRRPNVERYLKGKEKKHGAVILGATPIVNRVMRARLIDALQKGIDENPGFAAACFQPRHAIYARKGMRTFDIVICFECSHALINGRDYPVTSSPQKVFDEALRDADVPLGKREKSEGR